MRRDYGPDGNHHGGHSVGAANWLHGAQTMGRETPDHGVGVPTCWRPGRDPRFVVDSRPTENDESLTLVGALGIMRWTRREGVHQLVGCISCETGVSPVSSRVEDAEIVDSAGALLSILHLYDH